jgi:hypothetical protein
MLLVTSIFVEIDGNADTELNRFQLLIRALYRLQSGESILSSKDLPEESDAEFMAFSLVSNKLHIPFPFHPISHALWGPRHQTWLQRSTAQDGSGVLTSAARFDPCGMEWEAPRPVLQSWVNLVHQV